MAAQVVCMTTKANSKCLVSHISCECVVVDSGSAHGERKAQLYLLLNRMWTASKGFLHGDFLADIKAEIISVSWLFQLTTPPYGTCQPTLGEKQVWPLQTSPFQMCHPQVPPDQSRRSCDPEVLGLHNVCVCESVCCFPSMSAVINCKLTKLNLFRVECLGNDNPAAISNLNSGT